MLPVQSVLDVFVGVDLVHDLVGIFLQSRCEDHDLVKLSHQLYEIDAAGSYQEITFLTIFDVVDQGFVKVENECVGGVLGFT